MPLTWVTLSHAPVFGRRLHTRKKIGLKSSALDILGRFAYIISTT